MISFCFLQVIVLIYFFVHIFYCVFNGCKLQLFYLLIYINVFLYIFHCVFKLLYFYCRAWCRHPHVSTCLGGYNRYEDRRGWGTHILEEAGTHKISPFWYENGMFAFIGSVDTDDLRNTDPWTWCHKCVNIGQHVRTREQVHRDILWLEHRNYKGLLQNSRNVYTYEYGDKCVWIWKRREMRVHVYIHIRRN